MTFWRPRRKAPPPEPTTPSPAPLEVRGGVRRYRLAVCKGSDCRRGGSEALYQRAKEAVAECAPLAERVTVKRGGCYGLCHLGPNVVVREDIGRPKDPFSPEDYQLMGWDEEFHYGAMTPEKLERVLREHLGEDRPVEELLASAYQKVPGE